MTSIVFTTSSQNYSITNTSDEVQNQDPQMTVSNEQQPSSQFPEDYTLGDAAEKGDLAGIKFLLEKEEGIPWTYGRALLWAAKKGHYEIVKCLIDFKDKALAKEPQHKRSVSWDAEMALKEAVDNNHIEVVVYLLQQRIGKFSKVLSHAAKIGNLNMVRCLVEQISNLTRIKKGALDEAAYKAVLEGYLDILKYLVEQGADIHAIHETMHKEQDNVLIAACKLANLEIVKYLVNQGADVHAQDDDALYNAVKIGCLDIVSYLVEQGANLHAQDDNILFHAAWNGHLDIVRYLAEQGVKIHANEERALTSAAWKGHLDVVKYLIEQGANIYAQDERALKDACTQGHLAIVKYLVIQETNSISWKKLSLPR